MAKVSLTNVTKVYTDGQGKDVVAVQDFNIEVADHEFVVIVGPSGCGKSTTLRMIAGLEEVSGGDICIGDRRVNDVAPKDRDIAMVFQNYALYPHMNAFDNMAFGLKLRKFPKAEIKRRVQEAAAILGITDCLERKPKALSGGERQRVAVGRAIVRQPKVFLFDEPLSNLDAKMRVQMRSELIKLHQRLRATMIHVTHDQAEAMAMGDRIVVMKDGIVQQIDSPLNLYSKPANLFVAGFLGSPPMNFLHGRLKEASDGSILFKEKEGGSLEFNLGQRPEAKAFAGSEVVLGLRPEDIEVVNEAGRATAGQLQAVLDLVEPLGAETNLHLSTGAHSLVCRTPQHIDHSEAGHRWKFQIKADKAHLFDVSSTARIA
jgi:multiple sugar transport system ATP-binding protein